MQNLDRLRACSASRCSTAGVPSALRPSVIVGSMNVWQQAGPCIRQLQAAHFTVVRRPLHQRQACWTMAALRPRPTSSDKGSGDAAKLSPSRTVKMRNAASQPARQAPAYATKHRPGTTKQQARKEQQERQQDADESSAGRWYSLLTGFPFPVGASCTPMRLHV